MVNDKAGVDRQTGSARRRRRPDADVVSVSAAAILDNCERSFLAVEMGASLDDDGGPQPVTLKDLSLQPALKQLALKLLQDFDSRRAALHSALHRDGLTEEDLWKPGVTETLVTSSTEEEVRRYRLKLQYRADFLEAALEETLTELEALAQAKPASPDTSALTAAADASGQSHKESW